MPRKRDGFVPLGDVAGAVELPGDHVLTHRAAAAPARRRFTKLDQVTQLVRAREADAELGYMARLLALCSLPRTNHGKRLQYIRRNGPYTLSKGRAYRGAQGWRGVPPPVWCGGLARSPSGNRGATWASVVGPGIGVSVGRKHGAKVGTRTPQYR